MNIEGKAECAVCGFRRLECEAIPTGGPYDAFFPRLCDTCDESMMALDPATHYLFNALIKRLESLEFSERIRNTKLK